MSSLPSNDSSKPPITLYDIAEKVGVSYVTVSLALRNHPRISKARCEEVQRVAQEMGYRPNAMAAALASRKWDMARKDTGAVIAWLNLWPEPKRLRNHQEFNGYWQGAERAANKFGYRLEEFVVNTEMPLQRVEKVLWNRSINGILIPPHPRLPEWGNFNWDRFSVVRFGNSITAPLVHSVTSDQAANAILAFHKMREKGYQRIGFARYGGGWTPTNVQGGLSFGPVGA
ncbi:MAG: LacI family DNA-binding transcriptional regulator [Chthoniobacteraceae bacterium]